MITLLHPQANEIWEYIGRPNGEPEYWKWTKLIYILKCKWQPGKSNYADTLHFTYLNERGEMHEETMNEYLFSANFKLKQ